MSEKSPEILGGSELPDVAKLSPLVSVALGQNPSMFTGPGTNTYLVGSGDKRLLLDTGSGFDSYMPFLEEAIAGSGCKEIEGIVLTHAHPDHIGGVKQVRSHFGDDIPVYKMPWPAAAGPGPSSAPASWTVHDSGDRPFSAANARRPVACPMSWLLMERPVTWEIRNICCLRKISPGSTRFRS